MNVTITGYISFVCKSCKATHTIESNKLSFNEDTSPEAEEDDYIRYLSHMNTPCPSCKHAVELKFDIWEYPESVVNYSYYDDKGLSNIQCEFHIDHYYDSEALKEQDQPFNADPEQSAFNADEYDSEDDELESDIDDDEEDKIFNESANQDSYTDMYDDSED